MKSTVLIVLGFIALGIGAVGALVPILPTTPFVLVAAACFGGGSPKLHRKLKNAKYFGEFIQNYQSKTGVSKGVKHKAITFLWLSLCLSAMIIKTPLVISILAIVGIGVTLHIALLKAKP